MINLADKTALVTGASRGIERASARALATAEAHVIIHYVNAGDEAESLVSEICSGGGRAHAISSDLAVPDARTP